MQDFLVSRKELIMDEESSSPNIEWKKKQGFETSEKNSRKTDIKKSIEYEAKRKNNLNKTTPVRPSDLPKGLKKIRKKIKEAYEEDEEEDSLTFFPLDMDNSLANALFDNEKRQLQQKNTLTNQKMQQDVGRMEAILVAEKMARQAGLPGLDQKTINNNMADLTISDTPLEKTLSEDIAHKTKSSSRQLSKGEAVTMLRGIERIRKMAIAADESQLKALEKIKISEIINAGEKDTDDKEVAKLILKKSGRKNKKDINKVVQKSKNIKKTRTSEIKPRETSKTTLSISDKFRE